MAEGIMWGGGKMPRGGQQPAEASTAEPAAVAGPPRKYLLERVDDAAVVQVYADGFEALPLEREAPDLAPLPGRARRPRHLLRPAVPRTRLEMRDVLEAILTHRDGVDAGTARRDPALHEALLDQHRPLQQPDGAQVRPRLHARGVPRPPRRPPQAARGRVPDPARRVARRAARPAAADVLRPEPSSRSSRTRRRAPAATSWRRAPTTSTSA